MVTASLILLAAGVLCRDWLVQRFHELVASGKLKAINAKHVLAAALLLGAAASWGWRPIEADGRPAPAPEPISSELSLRGLFTGPTAPEDAAALASLCEELAAAVEFDGMQDRPRLNTGWAIADLRTAAREVQMRGVSIGSRQPLVRDAVHRYLDNPAVLGKAGGPIGPKERSQWVAAFRTIARAAEAALR